MRLRIISSVLCTFSALMVGVLPAAATCSNATLKGVYGYYHGRPGGAGTPRVVVGQFTADGKGEITTGSFTMSYNGTISTGALTGKYSISETCTGTLSFVNEDQSPADYNIVLDDNDTGFQMIQTEDNTNQPGFGLAQGSVTCGLTGQKRTFATNFLTLFPSGYKAIVGQLTFNGTGSISGQETFAVEGTIYPSLAVTGTYTEVTKSGSCTGSLEIKPEKDVPSMHFNMVVVNSGRELLLVETDNDTLLAGTAQE
jgi:hypothetical protein